MTKLTSALLAKLYAPTDVALFVLPLNTVMTAYDIVTPEQQAAFLATIGVESGRLTQLVENLNYSAEGLLKTWPSHFNAAMVGNYAHNPQRIANRAYANRMGNGDEKSGDGWAFRGSGLIQFTGRAAYISYAGATGKANVPLSSLGVYLRTPAGAADSAGWFWQAHDLNTVLAQAEDADGMAAVTKVVNGGTNGLAERKALYAKALELLS